MDQVTGELFAQAQERYEVCDFAGALALLAQARRTGPLPAAIARYEAQCLYHLRRAPEAAARMQTLIEAKPDNADYKIALAQYLRALGAHEKSLALLSEVPSDMPGCSWLKGWHTLRQGDFLKGFRIYEKEMGIYRAPQIYPLPPQKQLTKEAPLRGKTLLLVLEGGNGDEVAFVRFAQLFAQRGAYVLVLCSSGMAPLIKTARGVLRVIVPAELEDTSYDYWLPAMSSVDFLDVTDPSQGITFPYIAPTASLTEHTRREFSLENRQRPLIGIQWQGNPKFDYVEFKSVPVELLAPFAARGTLFSFQREAAAHGLTADMPLIDTETHEPTWEETAAALAQMDYVISADTTIAHLAGALGKHTLLLVPHAPHAYWARPTDTALWYPCVHIFRQPVYNDWEGAVQAALHYIYGQTSAY